jgi:molybdate transport system substrate-binding protein
MRAWLMRGWLVVIVVALAAPSASAADIRVMAAGSLKDVFTAVFADYAKQYGGGFIPVFGPSGLLRERLKKGEAFDVFASAALPHAQALTEAGVSGPSVLFARNALCVVTDAGRPLDSANLAETLLKPETKIGTSTPGADPAGDYTWEVFHLIDKQHPGAFDTLSKKAQQIFGGAATTTPMNAPRSLLTSLGDHSVDLIINYCSSAKQMVRDQPKYKSVELPPELLVGAEFGLTVSRNAVPGAADFAMYLLSPRGQSSLKAFGFIPVTLPVAK